MVLFSSHAINSHCPRCCCCCENFHWRARWKVFREESKRLFWIFFLKAQNSRGKKRMIIMTESSLTWIKKPFVNSHSTLFCFVLVKIFQAELDRSIACFFDEPATSQPPKSQPLSNKCCPSPLDPKKKFPCFSPQKIFFSTPDRDSNHGPSDLKKVSRLCH